MVETLGVGLGTSETTAIDTAHVWRVRHVPPARVPGTLADPCHESSSGLRYILYIHLIYASAIDSAPCSASLTWYEAGWSTFVMKTENFATRAACVVAIVFGLAVVIVQGQYGSKIGCMSAECTFWLVGSSGWSDSGLWARFYYCHGCSFDLFCRQRQADGADAVV